MDRWEQPVKAGTGFPCGTARALKRVIFILVWTWIGERRTERMEGGGGRDGRGRSGRKREEPAIETSRSSRKRKLADTEEVEASLSADSLLAAGNPAASKDEGRSGSLTQDGPPICKRTRSAQVQSKDEMGGAPAATNNSSRSSKRHGKEPARDTGKEAKETARESGKEHKRDTSKSESAREGGSRSRRRHEKEKEPAPSSAPQTGGAGNSAAAGASSSLPSDMGAIFGSSHDQVLRRFPFFLPPLLSSPRPT